MQMITNMENENHPINKFFKSLSYRGNENTLSDIIVAACNSSSFFKEIFLDFIFPNDCIINKCPSEIEREVSKDNGRNRFDMYFISNKGEEYVIENKIYDTKDHFSKYTKSFPNVKFGFIANYDVSNIKYENKHTWKEFFNHLKTNFSSFSEDEKILAEGILNYIQGVCGIMEERNFKLDDINDLGFFIKTLKVILEGKDFAINNQAKGSADDRLGYWVYKNDRSYWFGLYLNDVKTDAFSLWGAIYKYKTKTPPKTKYTEYYPNCNELDSKWFKLKNKYLENLSSDLGYNEKIKILKDFIKEIEYVK